MEAIDSKEILKIKEGASAANLPAQEISGEVLIEKYAKGQELSVDEVRRRVARALAAVEPEAKRKHWE